MKPRITKLSYWSMLYNLELYTEEKRPTGKWMLGAKSSWMSNLLDCGLTCDVSLSYISIVLDQIHLPLIHKQTTMVWQPCNLCCQKIFQMPPENKLRLNIINKTIIQIWSKRTVGLRYQPDHEIFHSLSMYTTGHQFWTY